MRGNHVSDSQVSDLRDLLGMLGEFRRQDRRGKAQAAPNVEKIRRRCIEMLITALHDVDLPGIGLDDRTRVGPADLGKFWRESENETLRRIGDRLPKSSEPERLDNAIQESINKNAEPGAKEQVSDETRQKIDLELDTLVSEAGKFFDTLADWVQEISAINDAFEDRTVLVVAQRLADALHRAADTLRPDVIDDVRPNGPQDWFPLVAFDHPDITPKTIEDWRQGHRLDSGRSLILFLGPGTMQARAEPVEEIEDSTNIFGDHLEFYDELVKFRLGNRALRAGGWDEIPGLELLRQAIVESARLGSGLIGSGGHIMSIATWEHYEMTLDDKLYGDFRDALSKASDAATEVAAREGEHPDLLLLGAAALASRLRALFRRVSPQEQSGGVGRVMGTEINWLADCAWHALIFRSPIYPTVRELVFQVDLCSSNADSKEPARRLEPNQTNALQKNSNLVEHTRRSVLRGFRPSVATTEDGRTEASAEPSRGRLLNAVARRLWSEHQREVSQPPFAVSLTFDLELERSLAETRSQSDGPFYVLVPILHQAGDGLFSLRWLLGTYEPEDPRVEAGGVCTLGYLRTPSWSFTDLPPDGPVVVKLNGSPLHRLPTFGRDASKAQPALLLREIDALDVGSVSLVANSLQRTTAGLSMGRSDPLPSPSEQAMPKWFMDGIRPKARGDVSSLLMVIGARWSDWSGRSQLFEIISWPGRSPVRNMSDRVVAVAESVDLDRASIIKWLNVQLLKGDCLDLIPYLEE